MGTRLEKMFHAAVEAAHPDKIMAAHLPARPPGRVIVIGAGKASAQMAAAFERAWDGPLSGLVVTRYGHALPARAVEIVEAGHPLPDQAGFDAAQRMMRLLQGLSADDLVVALISGGGSALLPAPAQDMTLADEVAVTQLLLASGMPISAMNRIRNELSLIKAGRLAALAWPAPVATLIISDIPGDDPALVASGPTIPSPPRRAEARALVRDYGLSLPRAAAVLLQGDDNAAPRESDSRFSRNTVRVIASASQSLAAAGKLCATHGVECHILSDAIEGEAREVARFHAALAREVCLRNRPFKKPVVMLSGGETTVTLRGHGRGGRNTEFLLAFALAIEELDGIYALAADTDGIDGSEANAGAFADGGSTARMRAKGIDPLRALAANDAYTAFEAIGDLLVTGPTGTNVNDFRAIAIGQPFTPSRGMSRSL